jgi:hypothetical protein
MLYSLRGFVSVSVCVCVCVRELEITSYISFISNKCLSSLKRLENKFTQPREYNWGATWKKK